MVIQNNVHKIPFTKTDRKQIPNKETLTRSVEVSSITGIARKKNDFSKKNSQFSYITG